jgi:hypothetical protein
LDKIGDNNSNSNTDNNDSSSNNKFKNLNQFYQLEKRLAHYFDHNSYCIFRSTTWNQFFYYFGPMVEDENKIELTVGKKTKFGSIDLADLVDAVYNLSNDENCVSNEQQSAAKGKETAITNLGQLYVSNLKKKNQTVFEFTPRHNITAEQLVEYASKALERENMTYEQIDSAKLYDYLHRIHNDNRFRARPIQHANDIITDLDADRPYTFPLGQYLNDNQIKTLIEFWNLVDMINTDKVSDDLVKALDRKPQDVYHFFKRNKDQFRRLR